MKVTVIIPARLAAVRFPGKPLAKIIDKPMIQWVYERASQAQVDEVIVATDSKEIFDAVEAFGGRAVMTRHDHPNGSARIAEVAEKLSSDIIINVQGDEPTIHPGSIDMVVQPFLAGMDVEMTTLAEPIRKHSEIFNPNMVKVVRNAVGNALYFSRAPIPYFKHQGMSGPTWSEQNGARGMHFRHIGIYGYRRDFLLRYTANPITDLEEFEGLEQLRALHMGARIHVGLSQFSSIGVDTPNDLILAETFLKKEEGNQS